MKSSFLRRLGLGALAVALTSGIAVGVTTLPANIPITGPGLIPGSTINTIIAAVRELQQGTGTPSLTVNDITGGDTSLDIAGQAAASATAAGGAVVVTGGASGATSGVGGAVSIVGGASPTSGNGGAVNITGGAATTSGVGGNVVVTAGASAGGTNNGGSINFVPTAAISTGIPGTVQINGSAALICPTYYFTGTPAATDQVFFIATRSYLVVSASEIHSAAAGGASALQVVKDTGTDAPGAGTDLLTNNTNTGFDLSATANTVQVGTLTATVATKTLATGNRLSVDFANAIQSSAGVVVTVCLAPL